MARKRIAAMIIAVACACTCLFAFVGCGSANKDFVGEWKIQNTQVTVVFSDTKFKLVGNSFDYTVDPSQSTITYKSGDATGSAKYSFSEDKRVLTLEEDNGVGGTKTTVFEKVSDNGNAEPSVGTS